MSAPLQCPWCGNTLDNAPNGVVACLVCRRGYKPMDTGSGQPSAVVLEECPFPAHVTRNVGSNPVVIITGELADRLRGRPVEKVWVDDPPTPAPKIRAPVYERHGKTRMLAALAAISMMGLDMAPPPRPMPRQPVVPPPPPLREPPPDYYSPIGSDPSWCPECKRTGRNHNSRCSRR